MEYQVEKLELFRHNSLSSTEGRKQRRRPETFPPCMGTMPPESIARKWFSRFKGERFNINDIPRSGRPSGFDEDLLNTLIHNDLCQYTRELANVKLRSFHHRATFAFNGHDSKIECMGTSFSKPKPQKSAGGHICISACLSLIGSSKTSIIFILHRYW